MDEDPVVQLVYELMRRGSVLPGTMEQVVYRVAAREVEVGSSNRDANLYEDAKRLCHMLPWYSGA
jgi:hypothetical protein